MLGKLIAGLLTGLGAVLAAPLVLPALGAAGVLGAAGTGTAIASLSGAALTSASCASITGTIAGSQLVIGLGGTALGTGLGLTSGGVTRSRRRRRSSEDTLTALNTVLVYVVAYVAAWHTGLDPRELTATKAGKKAWTAFLRRVEVLVEQRGADQALCLILEAQNVRVCS